MLNDTGSIYTGSAYSIYSRPWNFGQVKRSCLVAVPTLTRSFSLRHLFQCIKPKSQV